MRPELRGWSRCLRWLLLLSVLPGCTGETAGPRIIFSVEHVDQAADGVGLPALPEAPAVAEGGAQRISVRGILLLPDHCDVVRAGLERDGPTLVLRITARDRHAHTRPCGPPQQLEVARYEARIEPLPAAVHRLRVVYDYGVRDSASGAPPVGGRAPEGWLARTVLDVSVRVH